MCGKMFIIVKFKLVCKILSIKWDTKMRIVLLLI